MPNCNKGKCCGSSCINRYKRCLKGGDIQGAVPPEVSPLPNCGVSSNLCGMTCIAADKKCRERERFLKEVRDSDYAAGPHWRSRYDAGHSNAGYTLQQNACEEARLNLERDIFTLEERDPSHTECQIAKYLCNPNTKGRLGLPAGYGGSRSSYARVVKSCHNL